MLQSPSRRGFTLVELLTVVSIVAVLASIGIMNYVSMQYRAKRAELPPNVESIRTMQLAFEAAYDQWVQEATLRPDASPGKTSRPWLVGSGFDSLGWQPDGDVRGSYSITTVSRADFTVMGISDIDGDGDQATYSGTKTLTPVRVTANGVY